MSTGWYNKETIDRAIDALHDYLNKKESESDNLTLWDDQQDINLVIEPKVTCYKSATFNSIRMYVIYFADYDK